MILRKMGKPLSDSQLKGKLFEKLRGTMFSSVIVDIDKNEEMSYALACDEVNRVIQLQDKCSDSDNDSLLQLGSNSVDSSSLLSNSMQQKAGKNHPPAYVFPGASGAPPRRSSVNSLTEVGICESFVAQAQTRTPESSQIKCRNCSQLHALYECSATHCYKCRRWWPSKRDSTYHNFYECPVVSRTHQTQKSVVVPAQGTKRVRWDDRTVAAKSGTRTWNREKKSGQSFQQPVQQRKVSAVSTTGEMGAVANEFLEYTPDQWDAYLESNCDYYEDEQHSDSDQQVEYQQNVIQKCADNDHKGQSNKWKEACMALVDSGANISTTPPIVAAVLKMKVYKWDVPISVTFGNKTSTMSKFYVIFKGILGKVAIVESCSNTILSVPALNLKGFDVLLSKSLECFCWDQDGNLVVRQPLHKVHQLYYVDIRTLIEGEWDIPEGRIGDDGNV